jgi:uncharacterized protein YndB with AHSA1/START domain
MRRPESLPPIRKSILVDATREAAFSRFTAELASWWPLASHSVGGDSAQTVVMEPRVGGRIVERLVDGTQHVWGTLEAWDPPNRIAFTWHPGRDPSTAQNVEVTFVRWNEKTRVVLTHSGFERLGKLARRARRGYRIGWTYVLGVYAGRRGPVIALVSGLTALIGALQSRRQQAS